MTLDTIILGLGALIALFPLMEGLPLSVERPVLFVLGVCVIACGVVVRRRSTHRAEKHSTYVENAPTRSSYAQSGQDMNAFDEHESA